MEHTIMGHELTNAQAVGREATKCITEMHAPLPANVVSTATQKTTTYGYAGNHLGSNMTENHNGHEVLPTG